MMHKYGTKEWDDDYNKLIEERKKTASEPYTLLTPEWCSAFEKVVQNDEKYKKAARTWEGACILVFKADPEAGLEKDVFVWLDLFHGDCEFVKLVPEEFARTGPYVLESEYNRWKRILKKELNVVKEIATRKLKLVPFDLKKAAKLAAAAQAAIRLVDMAGMVGAVFPDDLDSDKKDEFKKLLTDLNTNFGI